MTLETIYDQFKHKGVRLTKIRKILVRFLFEAQAPICAYRLRHLFLENHLKVDRTTIYRQLILLEKNGLIRKLYFIDCVPYYELSQDHHHHLICLKCKKMTKIEIGPHLKKQEAKIKKIKHFEITHHSLEFFGLCARC